jgi:hypothetical protein
VLKRPPTKKRGSLKMQGAQKTSDEKRDTYKKHKELKKTSDEKRGTPKNIMGSKDL